MLNKERNLHMVLGTNASKRSTTVDCPETVVAGPGMPQRLRSPHRILEDKAGDAGEAGGP